MTLAPATRLGPYEIVALLGAGGMGEVYKARDTRLDRTVAIKILPASVAPDPQRQARFRREARAISSLAHPHICTLHDVGEQDGFEFLVMEYLAGETLAHRLRRGPLPLEEVLRVSVQLAAALDAAHRAGLVHRDLKPANVMLTANGAKVLDFGLATWRDSTSDEAPALSMATVPSTLTQAGTVVGTIQYMAPEQLEGKPIDARSDLFSLGAIVYEMTTGRKAFDGASSASVMSAILSSVPTPMMTAQPRTPAALDRLVRKCVARDPAKRWQTAADLRDELAWIEEEVVRPPSATTGTNAAAASRSRWTRLAWILAIAIAAPLLLIVSQTGLRSEPPAIMRLSVLPPDHVSGADVPIVSPDGAKIAFVARTADGKSLLWIRSLDSLESRAVADVDTRAFPFWSADGRTIAFFAQGQLKRVGVAGGPAQVICEAPSGRGGAWNREGVIVFAPSAESALYRVSASGGVPIQLTTLDASSAERSHRFPQFLADGRHIVFSVYFSQDNQKPIVKAASLDSSDTKRVTESSFDRVWAPPGYLLFSREVSYARTAYLAQPFNHRTLQLTGEALPVVDYVASGAVGGERALSVSNTGVLAYEAVTEGSLSELAWFDRTGHRQSAVGPPAEYSSLTISPDGKRVAYERIDRQTNAIAIWVADIQRGAASRLVSDKTVGDPVWSADGDRIAFDSNRLSTGNANLYSAKWNRSGVDEPLLISNQNKGAQHWSHDGRFLLFTVQEGPGAVTNLWTLSVGAGTSTPFVQTAFNKDNAQFSPDTRWVAYRSNEVERSEVYVQSFPDPAVRFQVSTTGGVQPRWRGDGKELFYLAPDGRLMAVTVKTGNTFDAGIPTVLFEVPGAGSGPSVNYDYDVSADGQRFLVRNLVRPTARSPIIVVLNWTAALKK